MPYINAETLRVWNPELKTDELLSLVFLGDRSIGRVLQKQPIGDPLHEWFEVYTGRTLGQHDLTPAPMVDTATSYERALALLTRAHFLQRFQDKEVPKTETYGVHRTDFEMFVAWDLLPMLEEYHPGAIYEKLVISEVLEYGVFWYVEMRDPLLDVGDTAFGPGYTPTYCYQLQTDPETGRPTFRMVASRSQLLRRS